MKATQEDIIEFLKVEKNQELVLELAQESMMGDEYTGVCVLCGDTKDNVEGDAQNYRCDNCGKRGVFGAEYLLLFY